MLNEDEKIVEAKTLASKHVDAPICGELKPNSMKCTRSALFLAGGKYLCAEHFALLKLKMKEEGKEVRLANS